MQRVFRPERRDFLCSISGMAFGANASIGFGGNQPCRLRRVRRQPDGHVRYGWDTRRPYDYEGVMQGCPVPQGMIVSRANYYRRPFNVYANQHLASLFEQRRVSHNGRPVAVLPVDAKDELILKTRVPGKNGQETTFGQQLLEFFTDAIIILHDGHLVMERYYSGMHPQTPHWFASATKSINACVVATLIEDGVFSRQTPVTDILHSMRGTCWEGVTVDHLLKMTSGVKYSAIAPEDVQAFDAGELRFGDARYRKSNADFARQQRALGFWERTPSEGPDFGIHEFLRSLRRTRHRPGTFWTYNNADSDMLGEICRKLTGRDMDELLGDLIWSRIGAEWDAHYITDSNQKAWAAGGMSSCLRDAARLAQMLLDDGSFNGNQIVPAKWARQIRFQHVQHLITDESVPARKQLVGGVGRSYNDQFWIWWNGGKNGALAAHGLGGQFIYVDPPYRTAIVKFSSYPLKLDTTYKDREFLAFRRVAQSLARG